MPGRVPEPSGNLVEKKGKWGFGIMISPLYDGGQKGKECDGEGYQ